MKKQEYRYLKAGDPRPAAYELRCFGNRAWVPGQSRLKGRKLTMLQIGRAEYRTLTK